MTDNQPTRTEVRTTYDANNYPAFDEILFAAIGRPSDYSGMGFGTRDHGWVCWSEIEAHRIKSKIKKLGLPAEEKNDVAT